MFRLLYFVYQLNELLNFFNNPAVERSVFRIQLFIKD